MSFWNRIQGYASEFVKSIDDGFANKNQQEIAPEDKAFVDSNMSDNDIIQFENEPENSKAVAKEISANDNEIESKNQEESNLDDDEESKNNENNEQNQNQNEISDLNNEKQEEENEEKIQQKINELKDSIKNIEGKLENQNKLFEKLQGIKEKMGPNSESLILEFETRNSKIANQIKELNDIEEKTKKEIEELSSNLNSLLYPNSNLEAENMNSDSKESFDHNQIQIQLQKDYTNVQKELSQAQDEYNKIIESSKNLLNEDQQLTIDIDSTIDLINKNKNRILQLKKERENTDANIINIQNEIEAEKLINIKLSTENAASEKDLQHIKDEQNAYNEKVDSIKKEIAQNKEKIKLAENENERANEKQRRDKIEAMKNLTTSLINQIEKERSKILADIQRISNSEKTDEENEEAEKREMQNMINEAEIESKRLEKRFSDSKSSISDFVAPIENQIETLKSVYTANETVEKTVASRLLAQLSEIEQKKESIEFSNKKLNEDIEKANKEKESLNTKKLDLKIKEINEKTDKIVKEIENFRHLKFDVSGQINQLEADISMKKAKLAQITSNKRSLESKYLAQFREIREKQGNLEFSSNQKLNVQSSRGSINDDSSQASSLFEIWKSLAKKIGEIDNEIEQKQEAISKHADLERIFNETLEIVSEHQEDVDIAKRTIQREKEFFKKRVQELMDQ